MVVGNATGQNIDLTRIALQTVNQSMISSLMNGTNNVSINVLLYPRNFTQSLNNSYYTKPTLLYLNGNFNF